MNRLSLAFFVVALLLVGIAVTALVVRSANLPPASWKPSTSLLSCALSAAETESVDGK